MSEERKNFNDKSEKVGQEQIQDLIFSENLSWQAIIYDLINTEQLNPWDVDISLLANKYLAKIREIEEADFFVSSKVLLAASLLLRIKSEILLKHDIPGLDDILFGKKENKSYTQERIELDEELPELVPRSPLPRYRKVTLGELMSALGKAIKTENRRIKKEIVLKQYEREAEIVMPKKTINIGDKIKEIYNKLKEVLKDDKHNIAFSELGHETNREKVLAFVSLLHLDNRQKVWLEQENHLDEILVWLKSTYEKKNKALIEHTIREVEKDAENEIED